MSGEWEHRFIEASGGVRLHVTFAGPESGTPVLLLHGFPELWYSWRHQLRVLATMGYRAIAPDQRGYNLSDKPRGVRSYEAKHLVADQVALLDALGIRRAHVVAHDWGVPVACHLAALHPDRVDRLVLMNGPHPKLFRRLLRTSTKQRRRSWYILFFQLPLLPERAIVREGVIERVLRSNATNQAAFTDEDLRVFVEAIRQPGAARAAIDWYRAARSRTPISEPITAPTRWIWGTGDRALGPEVLEGLERYFTGPLDIHRIEDASHWVQQEAPARVNELILSHFSG